MPQPEDYDREYQRIKALVDEHRALGQEIVVVLGVGFVGAVMAAIVADVDRQEGQAHEIRHRRAAPLAAQSFWKIPTLNKGISPVKAEDPEVDPLIRRTVLEKKTLLATYNDEVLSLADVVVVDVQLDFPEERARQLPQRRRWR